MKGNIPSGETCEELGRAGFRLIQDPEGFCFGEDTVLLSWFTSSNLRISKARPVRVLELGTNCGAASVLLAARRQDIRIDGVERQERAAEIFQKNIRLNHLEDRVSGYHLDLRDLPTADIPKNTYDAVFMNPPYQKAESGPITSTARHTEKLLEARFAMHGSVEDFISCASSMLTSTGDLFLVNRAQTFAGVMKACLAHQLTPKKITFVHPYEGSEATVYLLQARKGGKLPGTVISPPLIVRDANREYTPALHKIYFED